MILIEEGVAFWRYGLTTNSTENKQFRKYKINKNFITKYI
tara:strand:+ start:145 stop:264 length:120 start_codon:yes stop_codon:yes gene_type:complete